MTVRFIEIRQPQKHDLVAQDFVIAGIGSGFEGLVLWRVIDTSGQELGGDKLNGVGSNGILLDFGERVQISRPGARGENVTLQVFGEDASGENPPGPDLNHIPLTLFSDLKGWTLYEVEPGDNLTRIAAALGLGHTLPKDIFEANRDNITDPDLIFPGQVLRVPLFA